MAEVSCLCGTLAACRAQASSLVAICLPEVQGAQIIHHSIPQVEQEQGTSGGRGKSFAKEPPQPNKKPPKIKQKIQTQTTREIGAAEVPEMVVAVANRLGSE